MNTFVSFDENQMDKVVSFDDPPDEPNNDQVDQHEMSFDSESIQTLLLQTQKDAQQIHTKNKFLNEKVALLTKDIECYKYQLDNFEKQKAHEKRFEVAFQNHIVRSKV